MPLNDIPFTPDWKAVMRQARNESGRLRHEYVGPEHFLLGIIREGGNFAVLVLRNLEVDFEVLKTRLERSLKPGTGPTIGIFPQNIEARSVVEAARRVAKELGHDWNGTEHMLLGLIAVDHTTTAHVLKESGLEYDRVKDEVLKLLEHRKHMPSPPASRGGWSNYGVNQLDPKVIGVTRISPLSMTRGLRISFELAKVVAAELNEPACDVHHLLLGMLRRRDGVAFKSLAGMGVDLAELEARILAAVRREQPQPTEPRAWTTQAIEVFQSSQMIAREMRHQRLGTGHLLRRFCELVILRNPRFSIQWE